MRGILPIILLSILLSILYYLYNSHQEYKEYSKNIQEFRENREKYLYNSSSSPLKDSDYVVEYYEPNINFKVIARVSQKTDMDTIIMATSTGKTEKFLDFASLGFKLGRSEFSMPVYKYIEGENMGKLFFCFLDKTNNNSTYEGGRYIDVDFENAKRIELDFNKSYNPYCVYNLEYSCPLPSKENYINLEIKAGEKISK